MRELRDGKTRLASQIVNLTSEDLNMYDESTGEIMHFAPVREIPTVVSDDTCLVVDNLRMAEKLYRLVGKNVAENVAIIKEKAHGHDNKIVAYLVWAKDAKVSIRYCVKPGL